LFTPKSRRSFSVNILYTPKISYLFYISSNCVRADEILEERLQIVTLILCNVHPFFVTPFKMLDYYTALGNSERMVVACFKNLSH